MKIKGYISQLKYKPTFLNLFALFLIVIGLYFIVFPPHAFGSEVCLFIILIGLLLLFLDTYIQRKNTNYFLSLLYGLIIIAAILVIWYWIIY